MRSLFSRYPDLTKILAVKIPHANHTIHLDTLLTQVDYYKFLVSPILLKSPCSFLYIDREKKEQFQLELLCALQQYFSPKTKLIIVGDNINLIAEREQ